MKIALTENELVTIVAANKLLKDKDIIQEWITDFDEKSSNDVVVALKNDGSETAIPFTEIYDLLNQRFSLNVNNHDVLETEQLGDFVFF